MKNVIAIGLLFALACGAAEDQDQPDLDTAGNEMCPDQNIPEPEANQSIDKAAIHRLQFNVTDANLRSAVLASTARYNRRLGLRIVYSEPTGIPITVVPQVMFNGQPVDAIAHFDSICVFDSCNTGHGVYIQVSAYMFTTKSYALANTIDHEIGHVVSGWGTAANVPQHIAESGHLMSLGCVNHVCAPWTHQDAVMLCAGAPCTKENLGA